MKMSSTRNDQHIKLSWFRDVASVIEEKDGRSFEIGTVILETLANAIVGCTYYHHMLPAFEAPMKNVSLKKYKKRLDGYQNELNAVANKIKRLHHRFPEISEERFALDDPEFFDLAIPIPFTVPYPATATQSSYMGVILTKITPYVKLLGTCHELEILKIVKK